MDAAGEFLKAIEAVRNGSAEECQARQILVLAPVAGRNLLAARAAATLRRMDARRSQSAAA
jgi:hypothetical protein